MCGQGVNSGPPLSAVMPLKQSKARRPQLKRNDGRISTFENHGARRMLTQPTVDTRGCKHPCYHLY